VETDIILAHVKERDWLKPYAEALLKAAEKGRWSCTLAARDAFLYWQRTW
jgi:hypothetical protein